MWNDPEVFGGFLLVQRLAEGAMATVHLAVRLGDSSGRPLVLKRPPLGERPSGRAAQAILREAEVLGEVRGAGIPALEAAGDIAGLPYVALERLRGASLAKLLATGAPLPIPAVRAIGKDVGRALAKLHSAGWVHRDVTPSNIFVDEAGEVYLLDFGLAARAGDERSALVAGTRGYAAPEVAMSGAAHPARDVYGLAVCLAEAALGRRLFDEASLVEAAGRGDAPPKIAALEPRLPGLGAALRRDQGARPSVADLVAGLGEDVDREGLSARVQAAVSGPAGASAANDGAAADTAAGAAVQGLAAPVGALSSPVVLDGRASTPTPIVDMGPGMLVAGAFGPPHALTPTAEMPLVAARESGVVPTLRDVSLATSPPAAALLPARPPASIRAPVPTRPRGSALAIFLAAVVLAGALVAGFVAGRITSRGRGTSFAITGTLPKRTEVFLDGKKLTIADGVPMPVPPGAHTITLLSVKAGRREIPFSVRAGEHIVIVSPSRTPAAPGSSAPDDDGP